MLPYLKITSSPLQRLKGLLTGLFYFSLLGFTIIITNMLQVLSLLLIPFSHSAFRKVNRFLGRTWWGLVVHAIEKCRKIEVTFTGDDVPVGESALVLANHQGMVDVSAIFCFAYRKKRLGHLKWFAKDVLKWVPGPGWGLYIAGNFFVKRDWLRDQSRMNKVFANVLKYKDPIWLFSFPEGTRITAAKLKKSQEFCRERKRPVLEYLLAPRTKGFEASIRALRAQLDAVYDVTIAFPEGIPTLPQMFFGYISKMNIHVRRFPIQSIPFSESEISEWVWKMFAEKDALLKYFDAHHCFPQLRDV